MNEDASILAVNEAFFRIWDLPEELSRSGKEEGMLAAALGKMVDPEAFLSKVRRLYADHEEKSRDDIPLKDGRIIDRYTAPVRGADGRYLARAWYFWDITEHRKSLDALRESESAFRNIFDFPFLGVTIIKDGKFARVSPAFGEVLGYPDAEVIGRSPRNFYARDEDFERFDQLLYADMMARGTGQVEVTFKKKAGGFVDGIVCARPLDPGDPSKGVVSIVIDITKTKAAEAKYRLVLESAPDAIALTGTDGRIEDANSAFFKMISRVHKGPAIGESIHAVLGRGMPDADKHRARLMERSIDRFEAELPGMPGEPPRALDAVAQLLENPPIVLYAFRDMTERKAAEREKRLLMEQLAHAQRMESIGRLAGGVAHDFNNMLTAIIGNAELALQAIGEGSPAASNLESVIKAGTSAAGLTSQLLAFSRKDSAEPKDVDLNAAIEDMRKMLTRLLGETVSLDASMQADLPMIRTDPIQLQQVIMNLAVNARDAMPSGGVLSLETAAVALGEGYCAARSYGFNPAPGPYAMLSVSDTGSGMPPEVLSRLFEPFFTTKEKGKGTGLGLSMVYAAVKGNEGAIEINSEPGKGTTFRVYFPVSDRGIGSRPVLAGEYELRGGSETVLLVEDDAMVLAFASVALERLGYRVIKAASGGEGLGKASEFHGTIHAAITDMVLPDMGGGEVAKALEASRPGIRILYSSGYSGGRVDDGREAQEARIAAESFIKKPFTMAELAEKLRSVLDEARPSA